MSWALLRGLLVAGVGSGIANAAFGRIAVESGPHDRVGMGSGANNPHATSAAPQA